MIYEVRSNYETNLVIRWIMNDEIEYAHWECQLRGIDNALLLSELLKDEYEQRMPVLEGVWRDLLKTGFDEVDWLEVAGGLMKK